MLDWLLINITIFKFVLANDEPRGAWKTLLDSGFGGGSAHSSALRADPVFGGNSDFQFWRRREDSNLRTSLTRSTP